MQILSANVYYTEPTPSYVCSASITNYDHFHDHGGRGKCPLHDNIEKRHKEEVQNAADEAMAKVKAENPGLSDVSVQVSFPHVQQTETQHAEPRRAEPEVVSCST